MLRPEGGWAGFRSVGAVSIPVTRHDCGQRGPPLSRQIAQIENWHSAAHIGYSVRSPHYFARFILSFSISWFIVCWFCVFIWFIRLFVCSFVHLSTYFVRPCLIKKKNPDEKMNEKNPGEKKRIFDWTKVLCHTWRDYCTLISFWLQKILWIYKLSWNESQC